MHKKITNFFTLPITEIHAFVEAFFWLGAMRVAILTISFKKLTKSLCHKRLDYSPGPVKQHEACVVLTVKQAIHRAARRTPWESACLVQALTARVMLQKRHIPGAFYLGVAPDDTGESPLKAHAWSQCGNIIVTGNHGHERFKIMTVFSWNKS